MAQNQNMTRVFGGLQSKGADLSGFKIDSVASLADADNKFGLSTLGIAVRVGKLLYYRTEVGVTPGLGWRRLLTDEDYAALATLINAAVVRLSDTSSNGLSIQGDGKLAMAAATTTAPGTVKVSSGANLPAAAPGAVALAADVVAFAASLQSTAGADLTQQGNLGASRADVLGYFNGLPLQYVSATRQIKLGEKTITLPAQVAQQADFSIDPVAKTLTLTLTNPDGSRQTLTHSVAAFFDDVRTTNVTVDATNLSMTIVNSDATTQTVSLASLIKTRLAAGENTLQVDAAGALSIKTASTATHGVVTTLADAQVAIADPSRGIDVLNAKASIDLAAKTLADAKLTGPLATAPLAADQSKLVTAGQVADLVGRSKPGAATDSTLGLVKVVEEFDGADPFAVPIVAAVTQYVEDTLDALKPEMSMTDYAAQKAQSGHPDYKFATVENVLDYVASQKPGSATAVDAGLVRLTSSTSVFDQADETMAVNGAAVSDWINGITQHNTGTAVAEADMSKRHLLADVGTVFDIVNAKNPAQQPIHITGASGKTRYALDLTAGIAAAVAGEVIEVFADQIVAGGLVVKDGITIRGNGRKLTIAGIAGSDGISDNAQKAVVTVEDFDTIEMTVAGGASSLAAALPNALINPDGTGSSFVFRNIRRMAAPCRFIDQDGPQVRVRFENVGLLENTRPIGAGHADLGKPDMGSFACCYTNDALIEVYNCEFKNFHFLEGGYTVSPAAASLLRLVNCRGGGNFLSFGYGVRVEVIASDLVFSGSKLVIISESGTSYYANARPQFSVKSSTIRLLSTLAPFGAATASCAMTAHPNGKYVFSNSTFQLTAPTGQADFRLLDQSGVAGRTASGWGTTKLNGIVASSHDLGDSCPVAYGQLAVYSDTEV